MTGGLSVFEDRGVKHSNLKTGAPMSEKPISPLRQRMLEDMSLRGFTPDTQGDYIRAVKKLAAFLGRSPDTATAEDLRAFQLHLTASGVQPPTTNTRCRVVSGRSSVILKKNRNTVTVVLMREAYGSDHDLSGSQKLQCDDHRFARAGTAIGSASLVLY